MSETETPDAAPTLEFDLYGLITQHDKDACAHAHFGRIGDAEFHAHTADTLRWAAALIARERARADAAEAELKSLQQDARLVVPGVMRCAKCSFVLHRVTLHTMDGSASAGDNRSEPCPNGCGPLRPMTWKRQARELQERLEACVVEGRASEALLREACTVIDDLDDVTELDCNDYVPHPIYRARALAAKIRGRGE